MSDSQQPANDAEPIDIDPEIEALLDFEPVSRQRVVKGAWTPELQREFIVRLARHGSARQACEEMDKNQSGVMRLYRSARAFGLRGTPRSRWPSDMTRSRPPGWSR